MYTDKKKTYALSISTLAVLLLALILPFESSGRILAAILLLPIAIISCIILKKRTAASIHTRVVIAIMAAIGALYLTLIYLSGIRFGFYDNPYKIRLETLFKYLIPIAAIIVTTEIIRRVLLSQSGKASGILAYAVCVVADVLIYSSISDVTTFNKFMDMAALTLFPALTSNFLYNYLSKRYGIFPNIIYRAMITLYAYIIPVVPAIPDSILSIINLLLPFAVYKFIDLLYEKKTNFARATKSKVYRIISSIAAAITVVLMISTVALISNQFKYGTFVIATESMTGEINKGDAVIYERYDDQTIEVGQIIAFEKDRSTVIHRVINIEKINGSNRYYTQGDANEEPDSGYVTDGQIVGLISVKLPYVGYPTIWLRQLFANN